MGLKRPGMPWLGLSPPDSWRAISSRSRSPTLDASGPADDPSMGGSNGSSEGGELGLGGRLAIGAGIEGCAEVEPDCDCVASTALVAAEATSTIGAVSPTSCLFVDIGLVEDAEVGSLLLDVVGLVAAEAAGETASLGRGSMERSLTFVSMGEDAVLVLPLPAFADFPDFPPSF